MSDDKIVIIWASSRNDGNTFKSVEALKAELISDDINLSEADIGHFHYDKNLNDDFNVISKKLQDYSIIIFATPVYWYSMCAQLKVFFDRLSDLLGVRKTDGRALANKTTYVIANGTQPELPLGFEVPFADTSSYFDMNYKGCHYLHTGTDVERTKQSWAKLKTFAEDIKTTTGIK